jgi:hypothetical protein
MGKPPTRSFVLALVLFVQVVSAFGFWRVLDLHTADETVYLRAGQELLALEADPEELVAWGWPYALLSALLGLVFDGALQQDVLLALVALLSTLALFQALTAVASDATAVLVAGLWATASIARGNHLGVYLFTAALVFLAFGAFARGRPAWGTAWLFLAACTRAELVPWMLLAGLLVLRSERRCGAWLAGLGALLLVTHALVPATRERSWLAFSQHYALDRWQEEASGTEALDPLVRRRDRRLALGRPEERLSADFGDCESLVCAALHAPGRVAAHLGRNAARLPGELLALARPFPESPGPGRALGVLFLALAGLGLLVREREREPWLPAPVRSLFVSAPVLLLAVLVVRPKAVYLLPLVVPLAFLAARGARVLVRRTGLGRTVEESAPTLAATLLCLAALLPTAGGGAPRMQRARALVAEVRADPELAGRTLVALPRTRGLEPLLPAGTRVHHAPAAVARGTPGLCHVEDLVRHGSGALSEEESLLVASFLDPTRWRPVRARGGVVVLTALGREEGR